MGSPSIPTVLNGEKKFKTELTDYSVVHRDKTGPYADDLDIDVLVVGAGFSKPSYSSRPLTPKTLAAG
jgi:hypothetical protein